MTEKPSTFGSLQLRPYYPESDRAYACDVYLRTLRSCDFYDRIPTSVFYEIWRPLARKAVDRMDGVVACLPEDPDYIFGMLFWKDITTASALVSLFYVREMYRKAGIFSALWKKANLEAKKILVAFGENEHSKRLVEALAPSTGSILVGPTASHLVDAGVIPNENPVCSILGRVSDFAPQRHAGKADSPGVESIRDCRDVR